MHFNGKLTEFEVIGIARNVRFFSLTRVDPAHVYLAADPAIKLIPSSSISPVIRNRHLARSGGP